MRCVGHVLHAAKIGRIIERGGELGDATTHRLIRVTVHDNARFHEALGGATWAGVTVEAERVARGDHSTIHHFRHPGNVHAGRLGVAASGEFAHHLVEGGGVGHFGGEAGWFVNVGGVPGAGVVGDDALVDVVERFHPVDVHTIAVGCDRAVGAVERNIGVDPGFFGGDEFFGEDFAGPIVVEVDLELVIFGPEGHHLAHAIDWDFTINIVPAVQHQGRGHGLLPGALHNGLHLFLPVFRVGDGGVFLHTTGFQPAGENGFFHLFGVDSLAVGGGRIHFHLTAGEHDAGVDGCGAELLGDPVDGGPEIGRISVGNDRNLGVFKETKDPFNRVE